MPRALDANMQAALQGGVIMPIFLAELTFRSGTQYVWSGTGTLPYGGNSYLGMGSLGTIGTISEGTEVRADGTSLTLSGIDPTLFSACMTDIWLGAPAKLYFAVLAGGTVIGAPYLLFSGQVDKAVISPGADTISITLNLENRLTNLQRPSSRRLTDADQHMNHPKDTAFGWVEALNDGPLIWGA